MNSETNPKQKLTVMEIYKRGEVIALPGADLFRTGCFVLITLFTVLFTSFTLLFTNWAGLDQILLYQTLSVTLLVISVVASTSSGIISHMYLNLPLNEIKNPNKLLTPKFFLTISISLYFFNVGMWIVVLGGIWSSPFATLLSVSPVLYGLQMLYIESSNRRACLKFIRAYEICVGGTYRDSFMKAYNKHICFSTLPFVIIVIFLILGCFQTDLFKNDEGGGLDSILKTSWYRTTYALIYYLSVAIAFGGTLPAARTRRWTKRYILTG